jgi:hypothetical protein
MRSLHYLDGGTLSPFPAEPEHDLQQITWKQYLERYAQQEHRFKTSKEKQTSGGDFFRSTLARNGAALTDAVVRGALEGHVLYRDAARLLNVSVPAVQKIAKYLMNRRDTTSSA